jgi:hypothetical protein
MAGVLVDLFAAIRTIHDSDPQTLSLGGGAERRGLFHAMSPRRQAGIRLRQKCISEGIRDFDYCAIASAPLILQH